MTHKFTLGCTGIEEKEITDLEEIEIKAFNDRYDEILDSLDDSNERTVLTNRKPSVMAFVKMIKFQLNNPIFRYANAQGSNLDIRLITPTDVNFATWDKSMLKTKPRKGLLNLLKDIGVTIGPLYDWVGSHDEQLIVMENKNVGLIATHITLLENTTADIILVGCIGACSYPFPPLGIGEPWSNNTPNSVYPIPSICVPPNHKLHVMIRSDTGNENIALGGFVVGLKKDICAKFPSL